MTWLLRFVFQLFLAVWLGETIFLSLVVAPVLFTSMPSAEAGRVMSLLFPYYYGVACACGAVLIVCAALLWRRLRGAAAYWAIGGGVAALLLASCVYAAAVVQPRLHELRAEREAAPDGAAHAEFDRLHRLSVRLNGAVLLGNILILALVVRARAWQPEASAAAAEAGEPFGAA